MFPSGGNDKGPSMKRPPYRIMQVARRELWSGILVEAGGNSDDAFQLNDLQDWLNQYVRRFACRDPDGR